MRGVTWKQASRGREPDAKRQVQGSWPEGGRGSGRHGFTLIEVLLSLMLTGIVLVSTTFFIFSMGELWGRGVEDRMFDQHSRGVTRFVQTTMSQSFLSGEAPTGATSSVYLSQPPGIGYFDDSLISFELMEGPPFLIWPDVPLPSVVCYLKLVPGEGLFLLWHSRLEVDFEEQPPRSTLLSPFVTTLIYDYYDPETRTWTTQDRFENNSEGEPLLPTRVRLVFNHDGLSGETILTLPRPSSTVALF